MPPGRRASGDDFCCAGCARVYELIRGCGLDRFYELKPDRTAPPPDLRPDSFAWLDRMLDAQGTGRDGTVRLSFDVQGVHCAACVWLLQELFDRSPGAVDLRINPAIGTADVVWEPAGGDLRGYLTEAERFGYRFGPRRKRGPAASQGLLARLGICVAAALNAMIFSLCFYFGLGPEDGILFPFFGWINFGLGTLAVVVGGTVFLKGAWHGLRRGLVHLDLPIALGILLAWGGSVHAHLTAGPAAAYFDSLTAFVALMVTGRWMRERLLEKNRLSILAGDDLTGLTTRRMRDAKLASVPVSEVELGDEIWIVSGDLVPVDGILLERPATVSLDWIDGESRPRRLEPGARVPAGSFNAGDTALRLTAIEPFADSRLEDLLRAAPDSDRRDRAGARWWHRVGTVYVAAVLVLAAAAFLVWWPHGATRALQVAVSVLVVTCPCALGLATPLAHDLVHGALRRRGVFLRSASYLDRALGLRKILFDKTGTLTRGRLALTPESHRALAARPEAERAILAEMAAHSNHPASRCLARELDGEAGVRPRLVDEEPVREIAGQGLEWPRLGGTWRLGRAGFGGEPAAPTLPDDGGSRVVFSRDGQVLVELRLVEELREDAVGEIAALHADGYEIHLLSGDDPRRVETAAAALGIPSSRARGGLTPEAKADRVRALDDGDAMMVGDGLNDGPSFDAATCAATPAVDRAGLPARADFYFLGGGIAAVRDSLELARRLRRVIRDNLAIAALYNVAALALCFAGLVSPVVAAVLMPLSSAGVVTLTAARLSERRLRWR